MYQVFLPLHPRKIKRNGRQSWKNAFQYSSKQAHVVVETSTSASGIYFQLWEGLVTIWTFIVPTPVVIASSQGGGSSLFSTCVFLTSWLHLQHHHQQPGIGGLESNSSEEQSLRKLCGKRKKAIIPQYVGKTLKIHVCFSALDKLNLRLNIVKACEG